MSTNYRDFCNERGLLPLSNALSLMSSDIPLRDTECISLEKAFNRILSQNVVSTIDVPPYDNSAMDGYTFKHSEAQTMRLVGTALAGQPFEQGVKPGDCIRIMTGAPIPQGCDTVIMQEQTSVENDNVTFTKQVNACANVRKRGEDISTGSIAIPSGTKLEGRHLALLASIGIANVDVFKPISVAVLATGDELVKPR